MKGLAFRKLSRTSSHRQSLLRNLVTSLVAHERIQTTVAKAKEAQREAEKLITKAKKANLGHSSQGIRARAYLYPNPLQPSWPKLQSLAERFRDRPGGYTRLHLNGNRFGDNAPTALLEFRFRDRPGGYTRLHLNGNRFGDNAPTALLEFVDGASDVRLEVTARSLAREALEAFKLVGSKGKPTLVAPGSEERLVDDERFSVLTRQNVRKVTQFNPNALKELVKSASNHLARLIATEQVEGHYRVDEDKIKALDKNGPFGESAIKPMRGMKRRAGQRRLVEGDWEPPIMRGKGGNSVVRLSKGNFAKRLIPRTTLPEDHGTEKALRDALHNRQIANARISDEAQ
ncbi:Mitochondrial/chloroplast ribosomal protein L17 [Ceraceosorus bombacis]|uniref:Mitochondrial/chloroplast ribosomal protein L17 n=1 Tax=Ceraceosorus bombacis TaxID=401625 RepID=A0A0P1BDZ7_9BASI|nr:Mitochondrial/chloroplast ribosomal protein L17 [Ceraceosorus bombacis]